MKYNDKVEIISGFYKGLKGRLLRMSVRYDSYYETDWTFYEVDLDVTPTLKVEIPELDLEVVND